MRLKNYIGHDMLSVPTNPVCKTEYRESLSDVPPLRHLAPLRIYGAILDWDKMTRCPDNLGNGITWRAPKLWNGTLIIISRSRFLFRWIDFTASVRNYSFTSYYNVYISSFGNECQLSHRQWSWIICYRLAMQRSAMIYIKFIFKSPWIKCYKQRESLRQ